MNKGVCSRTWTVSQRMFTFTNNIHKEISWIVMCLALEPCNKKLNDLSLKQGEMRSKKNLLQLLNLSAVAQEKFEKCTMDMLLNSQLSNVFIFTVLGLIPWERFCWWKSEICGLLCMSHWWKRLCWGVMHLKEVLFWEKLKNKLLK